MIRRVAALLILVALLLCATGLQSQEKKIAVVPIKYDGLKQEILKQRGKVVIVDFWATFCISCIEALPHYVELQKKYADKGLVVITVSVDAPDNPKKVQRANTILNEIQSPLRNLILDEPGEFWPKKFDVGGLPFCYLFDRRGKWVRLRASDFQSDPKGYDREVEKTMMQMLNEK